MNMEQIQDILRDKVSANFQTFASAFADVDYARIGVVSKDDFRDVLTKQSVRLADEQVRTLKYFLYVMIPYICTYVINNISRALYKVC